MTRMKKITLLLIVLLCGQAALADTSTTMVTLGKSTVQKSLSEIIGSGLPVLYIETEGGEEPTCDIVYAPPGCWGSTITNTNKVHSRMQLFKRINGIDSVVYDTGYFVKDSTGLTIRVRGNTSAKEEKKPYKLKLQKKFDLLLRGNDSIYKDKEWVLLHDEYLLNSTGFRVSNIVGMQWVPAFCYVNVIINDNYKGVYMLTESVKRNPKCRLDMDKDCGLLYECDIYWWNEPVHVVSHDYAPGYNYTFKYPDEDDITEEQLTYAQSLVNRYEASINDGTYPDLIDTRSFAAWCMIHDLMGTVDGGGCNRYYLKYDTTDASKITMPMAWDFDMSARSPSAWSRCHLVYMDKLFNSTNREFVNEYERLWWSMRGTFVEEINRQMNAFGNSVEGRALQTCYHLDNTAWERDLWFNNLVTTRRQWFTTRFNWMDNSIKAMHIPNDVNVDGKVDITDVVALISMVLGNRQVWLTGDVTGDGNVNVTDVTELISILMNN